MTKQLHFGVFTDPGGHHVAGWRHPSTPAADACDGCNIMPPYCPEQLRVFIETVVPILQRRGLYRTACAGRTLREHLGLARPPGR